MRNGQTLVQGRMARYALGIRLGYLLGGGTDVDSRVVWRLLKVARSGRAQYTLKAQVSTQLQQYQTSGTDTRQCVGQRAIDVLTKYT